jgi:hypothetical protein
MDDGAQIEPGRVDLRVNDAFGMLFARAIECPIMPHPRPKGGSMTRQVKSRSSVPPFFLAALTTLVGLNPTLTLVANEM